MSKRRLNKRRLIGIAVTAAVFGLASPSAHAGEPASGGIQQNAAAGGVF